MERLLDLFGPSGIVGMALVIALPLFLAGWTLRRRGRRALERLARVAGARTRVSEVRAGAVTLSGTWKPLGPGRGLLEDERGHAVLIEHACDAPPEPAPLFVSGTAVGEVDDPRAIDYRTRARIWRVDVRAPYGFMGDEPAARRAAERSARLGATLFTVAVSLALATVMIAVRASVDAMP